jgi:predicted nucleic acid-binding protein
VNLVDTSVWIDFLRGEDTPAATWLRDRLRSGDLPATTEPIVMELLAGATSTTLTKIERLTDGLAVLSVVPELDYRDAAAMYRAARRDGRTVRRLTDCVIAAVGLRTGATVVHKDVDFEVLAEVVSLDHLSLR